MLSRDRPANAAKRSDELTQAFKEGLDHRRGADDRELEYEHPNANLLLSASESSPDDAKSALKCFASGYRSPLRC